MGDRGGPADRGPSHDPGRRAPALRVHAPGEGGRTGTRKPGARRRPDLPHGHALPARPADRELMRSRRVRRARLIGLGAVALLAVAIGVVAYAADLMRTVDLNTVDTRFSVRGTQERPDDIVVVGIDDVTFDQLEKRFPFPRHLHAEVIDRLSKSGAKAIAYDVQFTEPTEPAEDNALIEAVARAGNVVLSATEVNGRGESKVFGGEDVVR